MRLGPESALAAQQSVPGDPAKPAVDTAEVAEPPAPAEAERDTEPNDLSLLAQGWATVSVVRPVCQDHGYRRRRRLDRVRRAVGAGRPDGSGAPR
jgi:hypothetical protein